jgi:menaquinone-dependent protoporphyrinogen IX oxidase
MEVARKPRVLLVYYTYAQQCGKVAETMADAFRNRGCDVERALLEFTDERWAERFRHFPLRHAYLDIFGMLLPQMRHKTGQIVIPEAAREGDYDLVVIGSPTWFFLPSIPMRSYLESEAAGRVLNGKRFAVFVVCRRYWNWNQRDVRKMASANGGEFATESHFTFEGGQIRSFMSLLSYFGKGENRERYLGVKIPPSMLKQDYGEQARAFANTLADGFGSASSAPAETSLDLRPREERSAKGPQ